MQTILVAVVLSRFAFTDSSYWFQPNRCKARASVAVGSQKNLGAPGNVRFSELLPAILFMDVIPRMRDVCSFLSKMRKLRDGRPGIPPIGFLSFATGEQ